MGSKEDKGETICFCYNVTKREIEDAIKEGAATLMDVRRTTNANTGCGGCREDVKRILRKCAKKQNAENKG